MQPAAARQRHGSSPSLPMNSLRSLPACLLSVTLLSLAVAACDSDKVKSVADIGDSSRYPTMMTTDVSTFISDSGYTRYHITAPLWLMFEEIDTPQWKFPDGVFLEKYDDEMNPTDNFRADSATYLSARKLWRFDGNVKMVNVDGDRFATQQLFWDQNSHKVYSDSFMHIERNERIIEGYGFESNENMTEYTVLKPQMILPIDRMRSERNEQRDNDSTTVTPTTDTTDKPEQTAAPDTATPVKTAVQRPQPRQQGGDTLRHRRKLSTVNAVELENNRKTLTQ